MSIATTAQAEHWNSGEGVAHWISNQARYDRMHEPFTAMIRDAADLRPGSHVLDVGCGALAPYADADGVRMGAAVWLGQAIA